MSMCDVCGKMFSTRCNLLRHLKSSHGNAKFSCGQCMQIFIRRDYLVDHVLYLHGFNKNSDEYNSALGILGIPVRQQSLSSDFEDSSMLSTSNVHDIISLQNSLAQVTPGKRSKLNSACNIGRTKKARIGSVNTPGFVEVNSSLDRTIVWYYRANTNCVAYRPFLKSIRLELFNKINCCVCINPIKYYMKLDGVYVHKELSPEYRSFKTVLREAYSLSDVRAMVDEELAALMLEEDNYIKKSGFTLSCINGLLLGVYKHFTV